MLKKIFFINLIAVLSVFGQDMQLEQNFQKALRDNCKSLQEFVSKNPDLSSLRLKGMPLLHYFMFGGPKKARVKKNFQTLLGVDVGKDLKDDQGKTLIFELIEDVKSFDRYPGFFDILIQAGPDINIPHDIKKSWQFSNNEVEFKDVTPFLIACKYLSFENFKKILKLNPKIDHVDGNGNNALDYALENSDSNIFIHLLDNYSSCFDKSYESYLFKLFSRDKNRYSVYTPHIESHRDDIPSEGSFEAKIKYLLSKGCRKDAVDSDGNSLLALALINLRSPKFTQFLLDNKFVFRSNYSYLDLIMCNEDASLLERLIQEGAFNKESITEKLLGNLIFSKSFPILSLLLKHNLINLDYKFSDNDSLLIKALKYSNFKFAIDVINRVERAKINQLLEYSNKGHSAISLVKDRYDCSSSRINCYTIGVYRLVALLNYNGYKFEDISEKEIFKAVNFSDKKLLESYIKSKEFFKNCLKFKFNSQLPKEEIVIPALYTQFGLTCSSSSNSENVYLSSLWRTFYFDIYDIQKEYASFVYSYAGLSANLPNSVIKKILSNDSIDSWRFIYLLRYNLFNLQGIKLKSPTGDKNTHLFKQACYNRSLNILNTLAKKIAKDIVLTFNKDFVCNCNSDVITKIFLMSYDYLNDLRDEVIEDNVTFELLVSKQLDDLLNGGLNKIMGTKKEESAPKRRAVGS